jgi:activator of HSP90 ATPase
MNFDHLTRRQLVAGMTTCTAVLGVAGSAAARPSQEKKPPPADDGEISRTAEAIHQEVVFKANRQRVYELLTDAKQFDKVVQQSEAKRSGMIREDKPAVISRDAGGTFSLFAGVISGRHIELVPNERIVQAWRAIDWKPGVYSIASFQLIDQDSSTKLVFDHTGFPKGAAQHLAEGWKSNYWKPMELALA